VALIATAMNLTHRLKPSEQRADPDGHDAEPEMEGSPAL